MSKSETLEFITLEFDNLAKCKIGQIHSDISAKQQEIEYLIRQEEKKFKRFTLEEKVRIIETTEETLFNLLERRPIEELIIDNFYFDNFFTEESVNKFLEIKNKLFTHPASVEVEANLKTLRRRAKNLDNQKIFREMLVERELKRVVFEFISGKTPVESFPSVYEEYQQMYY